MATMRFAEQAEPTTPPSGKVVVYADSTDSRLKQKDDSGTVSDLTAGGAGEANTASNIGAGEGVFAQKSGVDLEFKSLVEGTNVTISSDADEITISAASDPGFYGLVVKHSDDSASFSGINVLAVNVDDFYLTQNFPNTDEVVVNLRGSVGGGGANINTWSLTGGLSGVGGNTTDTLKWGHNSATAQPVMFRDGQVVGMSISLNAARASGTCQLQILLNGVAQTGIGQTLDIDAVNTQTNFIEFGTPIAYSAGDVVGGQTVTTGFSPGGADPTVVLFCEDT